MDVQLLGEYLISLGKVQPEDILEALVHQAVHRRSDGSEPLIGEVLVEMGIVDEEDIKTGLAEQELARLGVGTFRPAHAYG